MSPLVGLPDASPDAPTYLSNDANPAVSALHTILYDNFSGKTQVSCPDIISAGAGIRIRGETARKAANNVVTICIIIASILF